MGLFEDNTKFKAEKVINDKGFSFYSVTKENKPLLVALGTESSLKKDTSINATVGVSNLGGSLGHSSDKETKWEILVHKENMKDYLPIENFKEEIKTGLSAASNTAFSTSSTFDLLSPGESKLVSSASTTSQITATSTGFSVNNEFKKPKTITASRIRIGVGNDVTFKEDENTIVVGEDISLKVTPEEAKNANIVGKLIELKYQEDE